MSDIYYTLKKSGNAVYSDRKSEFICNAVPCKCRADALSFIADMRKKYPDARHNVFAYITREDNSSGYSDDREPQGSAGMPALDVLRKKELTDVAVVVTRYFGGILLGTGGLVRAYSGAVSLAVEDAGIKIMRKCRLYEIRTTYGIYNRLFSYLSANGKILQSDFGGDVVLRVAVPSERYAEFIKGITDIAGCGIDERLLGEDYFESENPK